MELMARYRFTKMARLFKAISLSVLGGILAGIAGWRPEFGLRPVVARTGFGRCCTDKHHGSRRHLRRGGSPIKLMLGLAFFCLALAYAGVV